MEDIKLNASSSKEIVGVNYVPALITNSSPSTIKEKMDKDFALIEAELQSMRIELADTPTSESLVKLYELQSKGRAYYERAAEIFRMYLKFSSQVSLLKQKAEFVFQQEVQKTSSYMRINSPDELKGTKSGEERNNLILSKIPENLKFEKLEWESLETQAKINYNIVKSYQEQFRSVKDDILVQLSIIKNLIMLGGINIDPEAMRAFKIIESSYVPTNTDRREKAESLSSPEVSYEEGIHSL